MIRKESFSRFGAEAAALVALFLAAGPVRAVTIPYGNFIGTNVDYTGVEEIINNPGDGLFGAPTIAGDAVDFNPQGFAASSTGLGSDINDSNLRFGLTAHANRSLTTLLLSEAGDTQLAGFGVDAFTSVRTTVFVDITEVNGTTPVSVSAGPLAMVFTPSAGDYQLSVDGSGPAYQTGWTGSLLVNFGSILAANGISGVATKAFISLDNTLTAISQNGSSAFIQKKDADGLVITIETNPTVPEPATLSCALIALLAGAAVRRRA